MRSIFGKSGAAVLVGALTLMLGIAAPPAAARADTLQDSAAAIEALIAAGRTEDAVMAARDFLRQVTAMTGFGVTHARLIEGVPVGFGMFEPRASNVYAPGEPIYAYVELYGYTLTPQPNGAVELLFDVSFTLETPEGAQVTDEMVPMGDVRLLSFSDPIDGYFHLTYRINGVSGPYILRTHVTDRASGQSAEFTLPVVFGAAPPAASAGK